MIAGVVLAFQAALGALLLMLEVAVVGAMLYVGWSWLQSGEFRLMRRSNFA